MYYIAGSGAALADSKAELHNANDPIEYFAQ